MSALTLEGTVARDDFGGPVLMLRTADGQTYQLEGDVSPALVGRRVRVHGAQAEAQFGFAMVGPVIAVQRVEPLG